MGKAIRIFQRQRIAPGGKLSRREENLWAMWNWSGEWQRVYICAPYDGPKTRSREKLWWYCQFAVEHGCIPVTPYMYYPEFMYEDKEGERQKMDLFAKGDVCLADEVWVFGDVLTPEMKMALDVAHYLGMYIRHLPDWDVIRDYKLEEDEANE